jgi:hypothetical protein
LDEATLTAAATAALEAAAAAAGLPRAWEAAGN